MKGEWLRAEAVRNFCVVGHVDHGKTTLVDGLLAHKGFVSGRLVGHLRYMDSRSDEQQRGITMKSSAISFRHRCDGSVSSALPRSYGQVTLGADHLLNLVDSPGHVDFGAEVGTASRLCDGAVVVVDVLEGVGAQTNAVLRQASRESLRPLLVLNKIDRLITELRLTPAEAYRRISAVLERVRRPHTPTPPNGCLAQVNSIAGEIFLSAVIERHERDDTSAPPDAADDEAEQSLYFDPARGNVLFASAIDGWAFQTSDFARIFADKLGVKADVLRRTLWGDYYLDSKSRRVLPGAVERGRRPLFVQLVLENVWAIYDALLVDKDDAKVEKITRALGVDMTARDRRHRDPRIRLQAIFSQWLPAAVAFLDAVCRVLPNPTQLTDARLDRLSPHSTAIRESIRTCDSSASAPVVVLVSKMVSALRRELPENTKVALSPEEMQQRRQEALARQKERQVHFADEDRVDEFVPDDPPHPPPAPDTQVVFLGFARVFSGTLYRGDRLFVISDKPTAEPRTVTVGALYLFMGRELEPVESAPAGYLVGVGGLDDCVLKSATLSSERHCPCLSLVEFSSDPIVRVSIEAANVGQMAALVRGLRLLNQADPCVQTFVQATGEHVLVTAGEVHLERCLTDLRERFASDVSDFVVSKPIVPFLETIVEVPKLDQTHELIEHTNVKSEPITISTANSVFQFTLRAVPLPTYVVELLNCNTAAIEELEGECSAHSAHRTDKDEAMDAQSRERCAAFRKSLVGAFERVWKENRSNSRSYWSSRDIGETLRMVELIWSFGPRTARANLLFNAIDDYAARPSIWGGDGGGALQPLDQSVVTGFQLRCAAGALCEEPLRGVGFVVERWAADGAATSDAYGPLSGQTIVAIKDGCARALRQCPQRLMAAMYSCTIHATADVLGRVYAVLSKRSGRVTSEEVNEGTNVFQVCAALPVVESFGFAEEMRKRTSGFASPQLIFSHWEVVDVDPFWVPSTEEELSHFGEKADSENRARRYMNAIRRRKGLSVDEQIVEFAEKQRTLKKNK